MEECDIKAAKLTRDVGLSHGLVTHWKRGSQSPGTEVVVKLAKYFGVSTDYLLTGRNASQKHEEQSIIDIINVCRSLNDDGRGRVRDYAEDLSSSVKFSKPPLKANTTKTPEDNFNEEYSDDITYISVKVYDPPAAAGLGNYLDEYSTYEEMDFKESIVPRKTSIGIRISGDSMEPHILDGSIAWVQERQQIENGQTGIFILNGESFCKKLSVDHKNRIVKLLSHNPKYSPIEIEDGDDFRTVGLVLDSHRPI